MPFTVDNASDAGKASGRVRTEQARLRHREHHVNEVVTALVRQELTADERARLTSALEAAAR